MIFRDEKFISEVVKRVLLELDAAQEKHPPFKTFHHGYAVILEELDELWDEVKKDNFRAALEEASQVAAMAIRFIYDLHEEWLSEERTKP